MRILMLCTKYSLTDGDDYLTNDLAVAFADQGHHVQVVLTDWAAESGTATRRLSPRPGIEVLALAPRGLTGLGASMARLTKWVLTPLLAGRDMRHALGGEHYDHVIAFSPAVTVFSQARLAVRRLARRSTLIIWDFFPYHHRSIGLIPNALVFKCALFLEEHMIRRFSVVTCMTPMNETYLRKHYRLRDTQRVELLPVWGPISRPAFVPRAELRDEFGLPPDKKIVVFGGQMTEGRGVEDILAAAAIAREKSPEIAFLLIGSGRLASMVEAAASAPASNVIFRERVSRARYLELLTACDAGLISTVRDVDVPTFPSKIIDYLRAGLPVIASVEATTDFGAFVENQGVGVACLAGDALALATVTAKVLHDDQLSARIGEAASRCLEQVFDVHKAALAIMEFNQPVEQHS